MSRSVLRTELAKDRSDKRLNWTSTSVLDSKRTEVARDQNGCTPLHPMIGGWKKPEITLNVHPYGWKITITVLL